MRHFLTALGLSACAFALSACNVGSATGGVTTLDSPTHLLGVGRASLHSDDSPTHLLGTSRAGLRTADSPTHLLGTTRPMHGDDSPTHLL